MSDNKNTNDAIDPDILSAQHSSTLCQACGICCSGTLFSYVDVSPKEAKALIGTCVTPVKNDKGKLAFDLPCSALEGTRCTIYDKRPTACRTYLCGLTRGVMNGSTSLEAATAAVADIKAKRAWLLENAPLDILLTYALPAKGKPTGREAEVPKSATAILAAFSSTSSPSQAASAASKAPQSLRVLLAELYGCFTRKQQVEGLSASDKTYIAAAFSYAKIADRMFEKTPLLRTYGTLVQQF